MIRFIVFAVFAVVVSGGKAGELVLPLQFSYNLDSYLNMQLHSKNLADFCKSTLSITYASVNLKKPKRKDTYSVPLDKTVIRFGTPLKRYNRIIIDAILKTEAGLLTEARIFDGVVSSNGTTKTGYTYNDICLTKLACSIELDFNNECNGTAITANIGDLIDCDRKICIDMITSKAPSTLATPNATLSESDPSRASVAVHKPYFMLIILILVVLAILGCLGRCCSLL